MTCMQWWIKEKVGLWVFSTAHFSFARVVREIRKKEGGLERFCFKDSDCRPVGTRIHRLRSPRFFAQLCAQHFFLKEKEFRISLEPRKWAPGLRYWASEMQACKRWRVVIGLRLAKPVGLRLLGMNRLISCMPIFHFHQYFVQEKEVTCMPRLDLVASKR